MTTSYCVTESILARDTEFFFLCSLKIEGTDELKRKLLKLVRMSQEETLETLERFPLENRVESESYWYQYVRARPIQLPEMQVL